MCSPSAQHASIINSGGGGGSGNGNGSVWSRGLGSSGQGLLHRLPLHVNLTT